MDHVGLDLLELRRREAAAGNRQDLRFLGRDHALAVPEMILEDVESQPLDVGGEVARQHRRLVGGDDAGDALIERGDVGRELGVEAAA